jgi:hypothetical protein
MAYRYYRYSLEGNLSPQDAARALGETGGVIVRIDYREDRTQVTVATSDRDEAAATSPAGPGVEVREEDVLNAAG